MRRIFSRMHFLCKYIFRRNAAPLNYFRCIPDFPAVDFIRGALYVFRRGISKDLSKFRYSWFIKISLPVLGICKIYQNSRTNFRTLIFSVQEGRLGSQEESLQDLSKFFLVLGIRNKIYRNFAIRDLSRFPFQFWEFGRFIKIPVRISERWFFSVQEGRLGLQEESLQDLSKFFLVLEICNKICRNLCDSSKFVHS